MCKKTNYKSSNPMIDKCMRKTISKFNLLFGQHIETVACCCGHGKYKPTVVCKNDIGVVWELLTQTTIPRKRRFYKRDEEGYYYIPEVVDTIKKIGDE